jgi:N-acetylneuraminic acid mutarotase
MNHRRTTNRATQLFTMVALITLPLLAAAPPVHPLAALGMLRDADGTWTNQIPTAPSARRGHAMAFLGGDQVLLFGGSDDFLKGDTWVYDLGDGTWTEKAPAAAPSSRWYHAMASLGGDQVLLFGGYDAAGYDLETWVYDLSANTWTKKSPFAAPSARYGHAMVYLGGDQVLLFGGSGSGCGGYCGDTWVYDLSANTWT